MKTDQLRFDIHIMLILTNGVSIAAFLQALEFGLIDGILETEY